jgi:hypothetical protein
MRTRTRLDSLIKSLAIICSGLCVVGAAAALFVVLVRLPTLASTKLDLLFGTLQGVAVGLLFAIVALLVNLTYMVRRASRQQALPPVGGGRIEAGQSSLGA